MPKGTRRIVLAVNAAAAENKEKRQHAADCLEAVADALLAAAAQVGGESSAPDDEGRSALVQHLMTLPCPPRVRQPTPESGCALMRT